MQGTVRLLLELLSIRYSSNQGRLEIFLVQNQNEEKCVFFNLTAILPFVFRVTTKKHIRSILACFFFPKFKTSRVPQHLIIFSSDQASSRTGLP